MVESARDKKRDYLFAFEARVNELIEKELRAKHWLAESIDCGLFFARHSGLRDGMWVNAHMHADQKIHTAEDAACFFFYEICLPRLRSKLPEDVETGYAVYHKLVCPKCGINFTAPGTVEISFSCADHVFQRTSQVTDSGRLVDIDDLVRYGFHAGSCCFGCAEQLEDLTVPTPEE
jgi:hypothetical protein